MLRAISDVRPETGVEMTAVGRVWIVSRAVAGFHGRGGLERAVADLTEGLIEAGTEVRLVTSGPIPMVENQKFRHVIFVSWPVIQNSSLNASAAYAIWLSRVRRTLHGRLRSNDVMHVHGAAAGILAALPGGHIRVLNPHGMEEFHQTTLRGRASCTWQRHSVRSGAAAADVVIATDTRLVETVEANLGSDQQKIRVIPNSVNTDLLERYSGNVTSNPKYPRPSGQLMVSIGRLVGNKGYDLLPDVLATVRTAGKELQWLHIGVGPLSETIIQKIKILQLERYASLVGDLDDQTTQSLLSKADLFIQPSRFEGSSLTVLEALAHGRPTVATAVGGIPDKVQHGITGLLAEPSVMSLSNGVLRLLDDPASALAMGREGRTLVHKRFSLKAMTENYLALYQDLLSSRTATFTE